MNEPLLRQTLSGVYARLTRCGSRVFHASSAACTLRTAPCKSKGGSGGRGCVMVVTFVDRHGAWCAVCAATPSRERRTSLYDGNRAPLDLPGPEPHDIANPRRPGGERRGPSQ